MSERRTHFSQRDLARAMRAAKAAGIAARFEIVGEKITVVPLDASSGVSPSEFNAFEIEAERLRKQANGAA